MSYSETDTVKWRRILTSDMISSDSSGIEDTVPVLVAKEIPWRSRKVSTFFLKSSTSSMKSQSQSRLSTKQSQGFVMGNSPLESFLLMFPDGLLQAR